MHSKRSAVYDMLEENRQRMSDAGLLSEDTVDGYQEQYQFYVPLKGFAAITVVDENGVEQTVRAISCISGSTGRGFSITGKKFSKRWVVKAGQTTRCCMP